jgi:trans-aconitate methyltransferase
MTTWHEIWNRRETGAAGGHQDYGLADILGIDGFDSGTGRIDEQAWLSFISYVQAHMGIKTADSIFDVGCGAGAFLYPFVRNLGCSVGGLDFAPAQVEICRNLFPAGDFHAGEASQLMVEPAYDFVASFSVFFYFPDLNYASAVLDMMLRKARRGVMIFDVPDLVTREACESYRASTMSPGEYEKKYQGLQHLYYSRTWFEAQAREQGWQVHFEDQHIENYVNNRFRFNCYMTRP